MSEGPKVKFGAEIGQLLSKLNEAGSKVASTTGDMQKRLEGLTGGFLKLTVGLAAVTAALGGGAALKGMMDDVQKLNLDTAALARTLGITGERAGGLREALEEVGSTSDDYLAVFQKFSRQLRSNEEGLKAYGLVTRDVNGNLRDTETIIREAGTVVESYRQGVDRNVVSMELFGRTGADLSRMLLVTESSIQANIVKNKELNLALTQEGLAATRVYKASMNDVNDVLLGVRTTIGSAFIPVFTELANKFESFGPLIVVFTETVVNGFLDITRALVDTVGSVLSILEPLTRINETLASMFGSGGTAITAMQFFQNVLRLIVVAFVSLRIGVELAVSVIKTVLLALGAVAVGTAEVISMAFTTGVSWKAVAARWRQGFSDISGVASDGVRDLVRIADQGRGDLDKALLGSFSEKGTAAGLTEVQGSKRAPIKTADDNATNRIALQKAEEAAGLNLQKEHLKQAQAAYDDAYKNNLISIREFYAAKLVIDLQGIDATISSRKKELEAVRALGAGKNEQDSLKIKSQGVKLTGELAVLESQRYAAVISNARAAAEAERELAKALEETRIGARKASGLADLEAQRASASDRLALAEITKQQQLQIERDLVQQKMQILLDEVEQKRAIANGDLKTLEVLAASEIEIRRTQAANIVEIDRQMNLERRASAQAATSSIQGAFSSLIQSVATGTKTLGAAFRDFVGSIVASLARLAADNIAKSLFASGVGGGDGGFGAALGSFFAGIFGGGKADGGPVSGGTPYLVGERGPEMFVPRSSGTIIPNGGGGVKVTNNFTVSGTVDRRSQSQIASMAGAAVNRALQRSS